MTDKPQEFTDVVPPTDNKPREEAAKDIVTDLASDVEKRYIQIIKDNARKEEFSINGQIWKRRKISHKEYKELNKLRQALSKLDRKDDPELYESKHEEFYKQFAHYSLVSKEGNNQMTDEDFDNAEAGEIERVIDGINFRISYGLPSAA